MAAMTLGALMGGECGASWDARVGIAKPGLWADCMLFPRPRTNVDTLSTSLFFCHEHFKDTLTTFITV